jgi:hypothetical protein
MFTRTQRIDAHHFLGLFVPFILVQIRGISFLSTFIQNKAGKTFLCLGITLLMFIIWAASFIPLGKWTEIKLFPGIKVHKFHRDDWEQLLALEKTTNELLATNPDARYYVLGGGNVLNFKMLQTLGRALPRMNLLQTKRLTDTRVINGAIVDIRDFNMLLNLFGAEYVIVTDPVDYHLSPHFQTVVGLPSQDFLTGTGIAQAYSKLPYIFTLKNNGTNYAAYIFKKMRTPTYM